MSCAKDYSRHQSHSNKRRCLSSMKNRAYLTTSFHLDAITLWLYCFLISMLWQKIAVNFPFQLNGHSKRWVPVINGQVPLHKRNHGQNLAQNFLNSGQSIRGNWLSYTSFARNDLSFQSFFLITVRGKKTQRCYFISNTIFSS